VNRSQDVPPALLQRLSDRRPIIATVSGADAQTGEWPEQHTGDVLRARVLSALREADRHGGLRVYYPSVPGLIDPDHPLNASDLSDAAVGQRSLPHARRRAWLGTALLLAMLGLAAAWRWTALSEWLEPQALAGCLTSVLHGPLGPVLVAAGFVAGSLIAIPVTLLILVAALVLVVIVGPTLLARRLLGRTNFRRSGELPRMTGLLTLRGEDANPFNAEMP
jgi:hypothetical protein